MEDYKLSDDAKERRDKIQENEEWLKANLGRIARVRCFEEDGGPIIMQDFLDTIGQLKARIEELEKHCKLLQEQLDTAMFEKNELKIDTMRLTDRLESLIDDLAENLLDHKKSMAEFVLKITAVLIAIADKLGIKDKL